MINSEEILEPRWLPAFTLSRYLRTRCVNRPDFQSALLALWEQPVTAAALDGLLPKDFEGEAAMKKALRDVRHKVLCWIALRDLTGLADLSEVIESMTTLAQMLTHVALDYSHQQLAKIYGEPCNAAGEALRLMVIGMGKLGGRELNVSSDVDFIFVYGEDGETTGKKSIENFDFFNRVGKKLIAALGDITGDGQAFRVDMRLRPNGDSGALVCSLDTLENYFASQGREWERYAWIKARVLNQGDNAAGNGMESAIRDLKSIAHPFVFRRYLDFGAINAMRDLHGEIRREVARKDRADHIKLGPGGIREIEFIAQVFQLIRGGRYTELQIRPTQEVLKKLAARQFLPANSVEELDAAYVFLRRLEHRLQYVDDQQTHRLPENEESRKAIANNMGFDDWAALLKTLNQHRLRVSQHFDAVFAAPDENTHTLSALWQGKCEVDEAREILVEWGYHTPDVLINRLAEWRDSSRFQQLPTSNRSRLDVVGPRFIEAAAKTNDPDTTILRALNFLESILKRGAYLALLQQYPLALRRVADMVGASRWATEYLSRYPLLLDELLDSRLYESATNWADFRQSLKEALQSAAGDTEREMDILREMHHAQLFRLLAKDLAGLHSIEKLSDHLSELADELLQESLPLAWEKIKSRHVDSPHFAIISYGKLGGKELGYSSDLDLVYLFDDKHPDAADNYTKLAQRLNTWLAGRTAAGTLFEVDLRLRPNGEAGLIAVSLESFRRYQLQDAWVWEHQALTRARFCAGDTKLGENFESIRVEVLRQTRDRKTLQAEVLSMRKKMHAAHAPKAAGIFDLKHDAGGLVDVEFVVQYLVLGYAAEHAVLTGNLGNIALLGIAADLSLIPADLALAAGNAYREYRRRQHALRLNDVKNSHVPRDDMLEEHIHAVESLWQLVFGEA